MKILLTFFLLILFNSATFSQKFFIDADTGNEMDDLYAITYLLGLSDKDVIALSAAHFNNPDLLTDLSQVKNLFLLKIIIWGAFI